MDIWLVLQQPVRPIQHDGRWRDGVSVVFSCQENLPAAGDANDPYRYKFGSGWDDEQTIYFPRFIDPDVPQFAHTGVDDHDIAGFSSRVGVIIHELSHRVSITRDVAKRLIDGERVGPDACVAVQTDRNVAFSFWTCYWSRECRRLALEAPDRAVTSAENYEKFSMYVYMLASR
jgi:hypothetical protein